MKSFLMLLRNELLMYLRSRALMFWTFAFPVFVFVIMGLAFGDSGSLGPVHVEMVDHDRTPASMAYIDDLRRYLAKADTVRGDVGLVDEAAPIGKGSVRVVLDKGFGAAFDGGKPAEVKVYYDFSGSQTVRATSKILDGFTTRFSISYRKLDIPLTTSIGNGAPQRQQVSPKQFFLTGVLIMSLMSAGIMSTAIGLVALREQNSFKLFACLPIPPASFLVSVLLSRALIMMIASLTLLALGHYVFGVELDFFSMATVKAVAVVVAASALFLSLGLMLAARPKTVSGVELTCNMVYFPLLFLGDLTIPLNDFPTLVKQVLQLFPVSQLAGALRGVLFQGAGLMQQGQIFILVLAWTLLFLFISQRTFRFAR